MIHDMNLIGKKLFAYLKDKDLSQTAFGVEVGLDQPVINRAIKGKLKNPEYETIEAIATGMGLKVWQLLQPEGAQPAPAPTPADIIAEIRAQKAPLHPDPKCAPLAQEIAEYLRALEQHDLESVKSYIVGLRHPDSVSSRAHLGRPDPLSASSTDMVSDLLSAALNKGQFDNIASTLKTWTDGKLVLKFHPRVHEAAQKKEELG